MCGLFGYVGDTDPDQRLLEPAVRGAANRGPHAHGWAVHGQPTHRALGPVDSASVPRSTLLIGHARLGTFGGATNPAAIQPIEVDGHRMAHNGNAPGVYVEHPHAPSDSFALALVYAAHRLDGHPPWAALTYAVARLDTPWAVMVLDSDGTLLASRHHLPLHYLRVPQRGLYLSSGDLPGSQLLPEHFTWRLTGGFEVPAGVQ